MALTKVSGQVVKTNTDLTVGVLTATTATFTTVSVAGTITYDDVTNVDSVGLITARSGVNITSGGLIVTGISTVSAGTTSAPSISPSGDTNTGIFFPSADTIAFGEGGAEAARFDSSGRLLVGTSSARTNLFNASASAQLQIEGTDGNNSAVLIARNSNDTAPPNFHLAKSRGTSVGSNTVVQNNDLIGRITFTGSDGTEFVDAAFIEASVDGTPGANDMPGRLVFSTTADGASTPTERARITSAGLFGIGTNSPSSPLHLATGATAGSALFASTNTTAYSGTAFNTSRLYLSGGAGTGAYNSIGFTNSSNAEGLIGFVQNASGYGDFVVQSYAGSYGEKLRVTSAGNVGVGVTNPGAPLTVATIGTVLSGTANTYGFYVNPTSTGYVYLDALTGTTSNTSLLIRTYNNGTYNNVIQSISGNETTFSTAGSERARIDSSGRLLVGTSSSRSVGAVGNHTVQIEGVGYNQSSLSIVNNENSFQPAYLTLGKSRGTSIGSNTLVLDGDVMGNIQFAAADGFDINSYVAQISAEIDGTPGSNDTPGRLVFSTTRDGVASPTEAMRIDSNQYIYMGTTSTWFSRKLVVEATNDAAVIINTTAGNYPLSILNTATSGNNIFAGFWTEGRGTPSNRGSIDYNRAAGQVRYNVTSDQRLKSDIESAPSAVNLLSSIQVRSYKWTETGHQVDYGFIAQELNQLVPDAVKEGDDGDEVVDAWSVDNTKLVPLLTKALQEALAEISTLKDRVTALESA